MNTIAVSFEEEDHHGLGKYDKARIYPYQIKRMRS
jgi:hypothetical protein